MNRFENLSSDERAMIESKLSALSRKTGKGWTYSVTKVPGHDPKCFLQIIVDGKIAKPVELSDECHDPIGILCDELDKHANELFIGQSAQRHDLEHETTN